MAMLVHNEDPVIAELENELSKLMSPKDREAWLVGHEHTRGKNADLVWERWVAWLILDPGFGLKGIIDEAANSDVRCAPAVQKIDAAGEYFEDAADLRVLLGHERYIKGYVDIFLDLINEAQRIDYEASRQPYDHATSIKDALWSVAFAAASVAFGERYPHVVSVVTGAARAVAFRDGFVVTQRERAWAGEAGRMLTLLILDGEDP